MSIIKTISNLTNNLSKSLKTTNQDKNIKQWQRKEHFGFLTI